MWVLRGCYRYFCGFSGMSPGFMWGFVGVLSGFVGFRV